MRGWRVDPNCRSRRVAPVLSSWRAATPAGLGPRSAPHSPSPLSTPASAKVLSNPVGQVRTDLPGGCISVWDGHRDRVFVKESRAQALFHGSELLLVPADAYEQSRFIEKGSHDPRDLRASSVLERDPQRLHLHHADVVVVDQDVGEEGRNLEPAVEWLHEAPPPINQERRGEEQSD